MYNGQTALFEISSRAAVIETKRAVSKSVIYTPKRNLIFSQERPPPLGITSMIFHV